MSFLYFLGRFHVLVLHLPIALVLTAIAADWLTRREKYRQLAGAATLLWGAAAISALATAALGYLHFAEGGFTGQSAQMHRLLGTSLALLTTAMWLLHRPLDALHRALRPALSVVLAALVVLTGHYGGNLTHGDTYLLEYAPAPIRRLAGLEDARPPVTDLAQADPWLDIIRPMFNQRCASCHNNDKRRGELNLATLASTLKGGKSGAVLIAGKPDASDLYRRIALPPDHADAMPAEGKTPLTAEQVAVVRWWIEAGLPANTRIADVKPGQDALRLLRAQLDLPGATAAPAGAASSASASAVVTVDATLMSQLQSAGFNVRQRSQSEPLLIVGPLAAGMALAPEQVAGLSAVSRTLVELSLQRTGIDDRALATVAQLSGLTHLRLDDNRITDAGVAALKSLSKLQSLNLHGNRGISDRSIEALAALKSLQRVYLWQTGITPAGAARLRRLRPDLRVDTGGA